MTLTELLQILGVVLAVGAGAAILIGNVFYVLRSQTGKIQKEEIAQLQVDNEACNVRTAELQEAVHKLQGQIDVLKDIPLKVINKDITSIKQSNKQILKTLRASAVTLEKDTKDAKTAVRTVKTDLAK